jgi:hypothetical protein
MANQPRQIITAAEMARMSPNERSDAIEAATVDSWDDVPEFSKTRFWKLPRSLERRGESVLASWLADQNLSQLDGLRIKAL